jgi:hypothetical protein
MLDSLWDSVFHRASMKKLLIIVYVAVPCITNLTALLFPRDESLQVENFSQAYWVHMQGGSTLQQIYNLVLLDVESALYNQILP